MRPLFCVVVNYLNYVFNVALVCNIFVCTSVKNELQQKFVRKCIQITSAFDCKKKIIIMDVTVWLGQVEITVPLALDQICVSNTWQRSIRSDCLLVLILKELNYTQTFVKLNNQLYCFPCEVYVLTAARHCWKPSVSSFMLV